MFTILLFVALGLLAGLIARFVLGNFDSTTNIEQH
jgi:hypothetical protein